MRKCTDKRQGQLFVGGEWGGEKRGNVCMCVCVVINSLKVCVCGHCVCVFTYLRRQRNLCRIPGEKKRHFPQSRLSLT